MAGKLDFTVNLNEFGGLSEYVDELHSKGIKYIVIQVLQKYYFQGRL